MTIAENLKNIRKDRGMTQIQLSESTGIDVTLISRIERGKGQPGIESLKKLAIALNCSTDDLIFENGEREPGTDLKLMFERVSHLPEERKAIIKEFLIAIIQRAEAQEMLNK